MPQTDNPFSLYIVCQSSFLSKTEVNILSNLVFGILSRLSEAAN